MSASRFSAADPPRHICVVLLTGLGDVVHGLPVVNALKRAWPEVRITWVVEPMPAGILQPHPAIDEVVVFEKRQGRRGVLDLRRSLGSHDFDLALNFNIYFKGIWGTWFSRATERWTFGPDRARDGVWLAANRTLPARPRRHTQDMFLEFLEPFGIAADPLEWQLTITAAERAEQGRFIESLEGRRAVALVPASAHALKDWPAQRYVAVADAVEQEFGARAVLVGGPGGRETQAARTIAAGAVSAPLWMLGDGVRRLIWILEACDVVVAPDTGPLHIARAVGTTVVGLYGHTNPWRVGPYRADEDLWLDAYTEPGAAPDASAASPKLERMERIEPGAVIEKVGRALARAGQRHGRGQAR